MTLEECVLKRFLAPNLQAFDGGLSLFSRKCLTGELFHG